MITRRQFIQGAAVAGVGTAGFGSYALAEPWGMNVTTYRLTPPRWPKELKLKLAVLADLHACEPWMSVDRIRRIVAQTNAFEPDCVLLLGDFVAGHRMERFAEPLAHRDWAGALSGLKAPCGVHAVLGNHDWWEDIAVQERGCGPTRAGLALQEAGIAVHENTCVRLVKDGIGFWLAGLGDQWAFWMSREMRRKTRSNFRGVDDLTGTLAQAIDQAPVILMAHEPDIFPQVPDGVAVTICGHTHGGQVRVMGYAPYVPSQFGNRYVYGHVVEGGRNLIVSGGLGCSGVPVRFGSPPEIVMVELAA